jgi:hypothetical protein
MTDFAYAKRLIETCTNNAAQRRFCITNYVSEKIILLFRSRTFLWYIVGFGILLRTIQYVSNRSLWIDEAMLALNIVRRSPSELLSPLEYNQGAPIGFLIAQKLFVDTFGASEYALRLIPFLCGLISLILFVNLAKQFLKTKSLLIAVALFAISPKLIFYSSDLKQYSSDVAIALALYVVALHIQIVELNVARSIAFGIIGSIAIWFSHPALFVLVGTGGTLAACLAYNRKWSRLLLFMISVLVWTVSFACLYVISLRSLSQNTELLDYWNYSFMPFPPTSLADLRWFDDVFLSIFREPLGLFPVSIAALTFLVGAISLAVEKKIKLLLLATPMLAALTASGLHSYPFGGRLLLFSAPFMLLCVAEGAITIGILAKTSRNLVSSGIVVLLLAPQLIYSTAIFARPYSFEEVRPAIEYMKKRWQRGDILYLYNGAQPTFEFYSSKYGFTKDDYVIGEGSRSNLAKLHQDFDALTGHKRVWMLFGHIDRSNGVDDESLFRDRFASGEKLIAFFKAQDAAVYLYQKLDSNEGPRK